MECTINAPNVSQELTGDPATNVQGGLCDAICNPGIGVGEMGNVSRLANPGSFLLRTQDFAARGC